MNGLRKQPVQVFEIVKKMLNFTDLLLTNSAVGGILIDVSTQRSRVLKKTKNSSAAEITLSELSSDRSDTSCSYRSTDKNNT